MRKKNMILALAAALALTASGCGQTAQETGTNEGKAVESTENKAALDGTDKEAENSAIEVTYPLSTEEQITIWCMNQIDPNTAYADYTESPFHQQLQVNTGVDVKWEYPVKGADGNQAYNLLMTEEVLPDIIFKEYKLTDVQTLMDDGVIYDLTEYLPQYAPDYWAYLQAEGNEDIDKCLKLDDGRYYGVGSFKENDYNLTYQGPVVRKDWLDECGLDAPVTLEDWENMLKTFKEKYNATFGFYIARMTPGLVSGSGAYASFSSGGFYIDDNGKVQYPNVQPEWKEHMEVLNRWYEEGLIDKDVVTLDDTGLRTKVLNGEVGASVTAMSQLVNWNLDAQKENTGAEWIGIEYPRTEAGAPTCSIFTTGGRYYNWCAVVTTSCPEEKLKTVLEWLNYGFTEEGRRYWNYGTEGVSYVVDENGDIQWSELLLNDPNGVSDAVSKYCGTHGTGISIQDEYFVKIKNTADSKSTVVLDAVDNWIANTEVYKHIIPNGVCLTSDEMIQYTDKMSAISTRAGEMALKFFVGEESFDNFDSYVEELNGMGLEECIQIMQEAYDRYQMK